MKARTRKTTATVLGVAVVVFAAVSQTMQTTPQIALGAFLVTSVIIFTALLWWSRRTPGPAADVAECRSASVGAGLAILIVAYVIVFDQLSSGVRIGLGVILAAVGIGIAHAFWRVRTAIAGAVMAAAVVAYGLTFESLGANPRAAVGGVIAALVLFISRTLWRSWAVAFSALLAYAVIVYRLYFESLDDVSWRTLVAGLLILAFILIALRWWLHWRPPQARWAAAVITVLSIGILVFTLLRGVALLGHSEPPREQAEAPAVGFVAPSTPKPGRGFAVGMGVVFKSCDKPVHVTLVAGGTAEYWRDHPKGGTFRLGIPGTRLRRLEYGLSISSLSMVNTVDAVIEVKRDENWFHHESQNMTIVSGKLPGITAARGLVLAPMVVAEFDATRYDTERRWLEPRGQGTCFIRLPALSGNFTAFASEQAAGRAYPIASTEPDPVLPPSFSDRLGKCIPQVSEREYRGKLLQALYCPEAEIVHGHVAVRASAEDEGGTPGEVLTDESLPEPDTVIEGDPVWSCRSDPRGSDPRRYRNELLEVRTGFAFSIDRLDRELAPNCSGFVAVSEADADERRDVTLIIIGIGIALGLGALVELLMRWIEAEFPLDPPKSQAPPAGGS